MVSLLSASEAFARRDLVPDKPSVEVNLEVLQSLREQSMAAPIDSVTGKAVDGSASPFEKKSKSKKGSSKSDATSVALPERHVPMMNRGMPTAPQQPVLSPYTLNPTLGTPAAPAAPAPMVAPPSMNNSSATIAPIGVDADIPNHPMRGVIGKSTAKHPKPRAGKKLKSKLDQESVSAEDKKANENEVPALTVPAMGEVIDNAGVSGVTPPEEDTKEKAKKSGKKHAKSDDKSEKIKTGNAGKAGKVVKSEKPEDAAANKVDDKPADKVPDPAKDPFADMVTPPPALPTLPEKPDKKELPDIGKLEAPKAKLPDLPKVNAPKVAPSAPVTPDVPALPEPDMKKMDMKSFPAIEMPPGLPKHPAPSAASLPMPELPKDKPTVPLPNAGKGLPDISKLQSHPADKELPPAAKSGSVMPALSKGIDDLISKDSEKMPEALPNAKLPKLPDVAPLSRDTVALPGPDSSKANAANKVALPKAPAPAAAVPDMPELPDMPEPPGAGLPDEDPASKMMASLPPLDVPELKGGAKAKSGNALVSIDYPEQETQVPVNMQRQLKELAQKLISNNQSVRIVGVSGGAPDQELAARRAAYSRAMLVRSVMIDNGVNHANITIKTRPADAGEKSDRVEIVAQ